MQTGRYLSTARQEGYYDMCLMPIRIKAKKNVIDAFENVYTQSSGHQVVPCGKCPKCKLRRANSWVHRLQQQEKVHQRSLFVTLTYEQPPMTPKGFMTVNKRDPQLFLKRLRKATGRKNIKYYLCAEYGGKSWRPHYHAIMYDVTHDEIDAAWRLGYVHTGTVTGESIAYTTKYICKEKRVPAHGNDDRMPEFSLMSKNLGKNYLTPAMTRWHTANMFSFIQLPGGFRQALPRYYRDRIFTPEQREELNQQALATHQENYYKHIASMGVSEYYRVAADQVREIIHNARMAEKNNRNKV